MSEEVNVSFNDTNNDTQKEREEKPFENEGKDLSDKVKQLEEEIKKLNEEKDRYLNEFKRARADLINYKQEEQSRFSEAIKYANERIVKELIGVLDSFDLALQSLENIEQSAKDSYLKGIYLIKNQLEDILFKDGLEEIKVELGQEPDLNNQEIVAEIENDKYQEGTVGAVLQKGYRFYGKMIRPVRVAVVKKKKGQ
ncbi:MAG: nucleotide exchange factor GrpE [Minisyncoccia bacterium]|jgi:molecular chaperone GrpE